MLSFGERSELVDAAHINIIIGANNSGKSNIIKYLINRENNDKKLNRRNEPAGPNISILIHKSEVIDFFDKHKSGVRNELWQSAKKNTQSVFFSIMENNNQIHNENLVWLDKSIVFKTKKVSQSVLVEPNTMVYPNQVAKIGNWKDWSSYKLPSGGLDVTIRSIINLLHHNTSYKTMQIPAIRYVSDKQQENTKIFSGEGLITTLGRLASPDESKLEDLKKFALIQNFLREVLEDETAELMVAYNQTQILVNTKGQGFFGLKNLGTGIQELVIIATAIAFYQDHIICLEEPETHLHPRLQKKLMEYIQNFEDTQFFITTHSAALLGAVEAAVYHVQLIDGASTITRMETTDDALEIADDLGLHPSDLLQSNFVIWVEGPSDRIYVRHWLERVDNELEEGTHYSIMLYGGGLNHHLTLDDQSTEDLIELMKINPRMCFILDSDKSNAKAPLKPNKQRLVNEGRALGPRSMVWITHGREIENYYPNKEFWDVVCEVHSRGTYPLPGKTRFTNMTRRTTKGEKDYEDILKVKVAKHLVSKNLALPKRHGFKEALDELVSLIRRSNGL
jgi:predicted ATP-dependent endonuclease of OLD family